MPRISSSKRITLLVPMLFLGLVAIGWWSQRGPREPRHEGKPLSWWFTNGLDNQLTPTPRRLTAEELRQLGPEAVVWLGHQAAQRSIWDIDDDSRYSPEISARFKWWLRDRFYKFAKSKIRVRFESIVALGDLGPDAAPAIPSLLKAVRQADHDSRLLAAIALVEMGPVAVPAIAKAMTHDDLLARNLLIDKMELRWRSERAPSFTAAGFAEVAGLIILASRDDEVRDFAELRLRQCAEAWRGQPQLPEGIRLFAESLARMNDQELSVAADFLARFDAEASAATPALTALVGTPNELTRAHLLGALAAVDSENPNWPAKLYELAASANKELTDIAERGLIRAGK